jgi:hypothetical protein
MRSYGLGRSHWDSSVRGTEEDRTRLHDVFAVLFPNVDRATARDSRIRDAMHVSTAIRYGGVGCVTRERRLVSKSNRIAGRFHGFRMRPPEDALTEAAARIRGLRELRHREPHHGALPTWPAEGDPPTWGLGRSGRDHDPSANDCSVAPRGRCR